MDDINILITLAVHEKMLAAVRSLPGIEVRVCGPKDQGQPVPVEGIEDADLLVVTYPPTNLDEAKRLKVLQIASAGYSQLYPAKLHERGIRACNALGVFDVPIGEWVAAMMVNLARDLRGMVRNQEQGVWDRDARFQREVRGSVLGIWGYGGIGRESARLARAMGMRVRTLTRSGVKPRRDIYVVPGTGDPDGSLPDRNFGPDELEAFLQGLDFLLLAVPITPETEGMVTRDVLEMLPRRAYVLNPARGPLIEETALLGALRDGTIAGAALDTHYYYPMPPDHPLWQFPNVIMTPHISGSDSSQCYLERAWDIVRENAQRLAEGQPLLNELTRAQLAGE